MRLPTELLLLTLSILPTASTAPAGYQPQQPPSLHRRSASFLSLRGLTNLESDYSNAESFSHPTKFFHESTFSAHYDGRFASAELPHTTRQFHLRLLLKAYMETMERIHVRTWLMHGCLLGWWWNGHIMPWDTDIDVMVDERGMAELGEWWNMSVHHFRAEDFEPHNSPRIARAADLAIDNRHVDRRMLHEELERHGKKYLLEVNPAFINTSTKDKENVIDARWIDTATGLFIDITTVHVQPQARQYSYKTNSYQIVQQSDPDAIELYTKDQHAYTSGQIFPLRQSTIEGINVNIPYDYEGLLLDEYGSESILETWYRGWKFDEVAHEWVETEEAAEIEKQEKAKDSKERYLDRVGEKAKKKQRVE
ncbi:LicD family-domain-containing protein [Paraphoma chrysanthemicola]|uniref:LicD family-domain-containing protein n=1 Tax=Paraphoma chrysanthemicola TaxID=798071 RepID=A0A8K0RD68_9PLEO|nr:LicD family-domain-containing protein [Paraphoma chrysanthemicola]